jgi:hypothetical protein
MYMWHHRWYLWSALSVLLVKFRSSDSPPAAERPGLPRPPTRRCFCLDGASRSGLMRTHGTRPDGFTLNPRQGGRSLEWDIIVVDTFAASCLAARSIADGAASAAAVARLSVKYASLTSTFNFNPIALETPGAMNYEALEFFVEVGRCVAVNSNDNRKISFSCSVCLCSYVSMRWPFGALPPTTASFSPNVLRKFLALLFIF